MLFRSSEFFEQEKLRQKMKRDEEKAQNIREALAVGEEVPKRDVNWLKKYEDELAAQALGQAAHEALSATDQALAVEEGTAAESQNVRESSYETESSSDEYEEAAHLEDEIPFYEEADEESDSSEKDHV